MEEAKENPTQVCKICNGIKKDRTNWSPLESKHELPDYLKEWLGVKKAS